MVSAKGSWSPSAEREKLWRGAVLKISIQEKRIEQDDNRENAVGGVGAREVQVYEDS